MGFYSHKVFVCPFFKQDERLGIFCEGGKLKFQDREAAREYTDGHCASMDGWKRCSLARNLLDYYERKE